MGQAGRTTEGERTGEGRPLCRRNSDSGAQLTAGPFERAEPQEPVHRLRRSTKIFYWIYDIPNWAAALLFSIVFVAFALLGVILVRPWVRQWLDPQPDWNRVIGHLLAFQSVFYGLLVGLIAVATFENFSDVDRTVGREAASLGSLYRDVSSYPDPMRQDLQEILREYSRYVIDEAWPLQRRGIIQEAGTARITAFQQKLLSFQPTTRAQEILHAETIHQFNVYLALSHLRLHSVTTGLPAVLWYVVIVGAILSIALTWLVSIRQLRAHLVVVGMLSLFIGLLVFLVAAMDNPYRGEFSITSEAFESIYRRLMAPGVRATP